MVKSAETESRMVDVGDWGRENRESVFNGDRIAVLKDDNTKLLWEAPERGEPTVNGQACGGPISCCIGGRSTRF